MRSLTWATGGAAFLTAFLACGTGFPQSAPTAHDRGASPILRQGTIHEEDLSGTARAPAPALQEANPKGSPETPRPGESLESALPAPARPATTSPDDRLAGSPDDSLDPDDRYELPPLADIASALSRRRASVKLVQQGQDLLRTKNYKAALSQFERAIGVDATNPYSHYFVARAHYFLDNYRQSLSFLDVAEQKLAADGRWLAEIHVLRARNATALGFHGQADINYIRALALDPRHGFALARLTTIKTLARTDRNR